MKLAKVSFMRGNKERQCLITVGNVQENDSVLSRAQNHDIDLLVAERNRFMFERLWVVHHCLFRMTLKGF